MGERGPYGYFTPRQPAPGAHKCHPPVRSDAGRAPEPFDSPGQGWRCPCGKAWVVVQHSDQREGTWKVWVRLPREDMT